MRPGPTGIFFRGLAMGAADIVPGVSGGTVALITGIYDRLVAAIASVDTDLLRLLARGRIAAVWERVDGGFLTALMLGIATSIVVLSRGIHWLMAFAPLPLWSFFFGLVAASAVYLLRTEVWRPSLREGLLLFVGTMVAVAISLAPAIEFPGGAVGFFAAGSLAICAMILPGISGSFILLILGMYAPVIRALTLPEPLLLLAFLSGCIVGLLAFSKVLRHLIGRARRATMAMLTGFLAGSLVALWPWQRVVAEMVDRHGQLRPVQTLPVSPAQYAQTSGDPALLVCAVALLLGVTIVVLGHWLDRSSQSA